MQAHDSIPNASPWQHTRASLAPQKLPLLLQNRNEGRTVFQMEESEVHLPSAGFNFHFYVFLRPTSYVMLRCFSRWWTHINADGLTLCTLCDPHIIWRWLQPGSTVIHMQPTLTFTCPLELKISTVFVSWALLCKCEEVVFWPISEVTSTFVSWDTWKIIISWDLMIKLVTECRRS